MNKILKNKSGNLILELRKESASAWLTVKRSDRLVDEQDILDLIDEAGIKAGFNEAIQMMRERGLEKDFDIPFPIAVSHNEDCSHELKLHYHFDATLTREQISILGLKDLAKLSYASKGDCLAAYSDNIFEREGSIYDIFGELISPMAVDDEQAQKLAGTKVGYEAGEYVALATGYPYLDDDGKICILDSLTIKADCCDADEAIRSPLALEILGDIENCNIAVANSLKVTGNIKDCSVFCEKDLVVEGSIIGCMNPGIQVLGDLQVCSIIRSRVLVRHDVRFRDSINDSTLALDGSITGLTEESNISGGVCQAANDIRIGIAGGDSETEIEIAISPFYRAMLMQMTKELVRLRDEGEDLAIAKLQERINRCEAELDKQLNAFLIRDPDDKKRVLVSTQVYPKTVFRILKHVYPIKNAQRGIELIEKE